MSSRGRSDLRCIYCCCLSSGAVQMAERRPEALPQEFVGNGEPRSPGWQQQQQRRQPAATIPESESPDLPPTTTIWCCTSLFTPETMSLQTVSHCGAGCQYYSTALWSIWPIPANKQQQYQHSATPRLAAAHRVTATSGHYRLSFLSSG